MKIEYVRPEIEMIELRKVDVITASGDYNDDVFSDENVFSNSDKDGKFSNFH